ncbi:MAG: DUF480 domain-containing protein [Pseudomonadales bacterium]|nr:DUF480 domain-containing protein [Pseudomonadales bacterium]
MANKFDLTLNEQRVIGCLLEKEITTPDQYPLSLNGLTNACNQKSNREPVLNLSEDDVQATLDALKEKRLISNETGFGSRVVKYRHRFCNTEFGDFSLSGQELGVVCVMLLRGPQTPGELRTRTNRLCEFNDVSEVDSVLGQLAARSDGPFVVRLEREPGKRESRYQHLFGEHGADKVVISEPENIPDSPHSELVQLQQKVAYLEAKLAYLYEHLDMKFEGD